MKIDKVVDDMYLIWYTRKMVLLHGIIKKTQKTPDRDLDLAVARQKGLK